MDWSVPVTNTDSGKRMVFFLLFDLGYDKLKGELRKLGFKARPTTIRTVLQRHGIPPAPERSRSSSS